MGVGDYTVEKGWVLKIDWVYNTPTRLFMDKNCLRVDFKSNACGGVKTHCVAYT